jgi:protein-L-isoaspartate(D-aspartate) O-methyltransferase
MTEHNFEHMRRAMVASQLRTTGVSDPRVVAAMGAVPRERFVPDARVPIAYADVQVPLEDGRALNSPMALGRLLTELHPRESERALVVAAATGYSAAVMARLAKEVVALEEHPALVTRARAALNANTVADGNVELVEGPLAQGHAPGAPYDLILIDGAVEFVPQALIDQLRDGGRLAAAVLERGVSRISIGRKAGEGFGMAAVADVAATILPGFVKPRTFTF